jgi:Ca2+-transporting ATPase
MMATVHEDGDGWHAAVKGAPEAVLSASKRIAGPEGERDFGTQERRTWQERSEALAAEGLRVLGVATRTMADREADPYDALRFVGLVAMADPPRREVPEAVAACGRAGIRVIMVTGDHPATAGKIAQRVGIAQAEAPEVVQGRDLKHPQDVSREERREQLQRRVFARVSPKQKLDLIGLHQGAGAVVAMTGDGVNDAPALKKADIGVAMGKRGTQVAREAADMVLQDNAFGTIVKAVAQGRTIFENIRKFILFLLSGNVGEILIVGIAILAGAPLPLLPLQILYLNMIGDVFPALALAAGGGDEARMQAPPRDAREPILTRRHWMAIGAYGALIAAAVLTAFWIARTPLGLAPERTVTISFLCLSFARLWHVFNMRSAASNVVANEISRNVYVWGALVLCTVLLLTAIYLPGLSGVLKLVAPRPLEWALILGFSLVPLVVGQAALALWGSRRTR